MNYYIAIGLQGKPPSDHQLNLINMFIEDLLEDQAEIVTDAEWEETL